MKIDYCTNPGDKNHDWYILDYQKQSEHMDPSKGFGDTLKVKFVCKKCLKFIIKRETVWYE